MATIIGIMGESGSGKTTSMRNLVCLSDMPRRLRRSKAMRRMRKSVHGRRNERRSLRGLCRQIPQ